MHTTDANEVDTTNGNSALHLSTLGGHLAIVQSLLEAGADPLKINNDGMTALDMCSTKVFFVNNDRMTLDLCSKIFYLNNDGMTLLIFVVLQVFYFHLDFINLAVFYCICNINGLYVSLLIFVLFLLCMLYVIFLIDIFY